MAPFEFLSNLLGRGNGGSDDGSDGKDGSSDDGGWRNDGDDDGAGQGSPGESSDGDGEVDLAAIDPGEFAAAAEEFAAEYSVGDAEFDFSVESLEDLDEVARRVAGELDAASDEFGGDSEAVVDAGAHYFLQVGSYFGEVLVREFDGEWAYTEAWVVTGCEGATADVPVFELARAAVVEGDPAFARVARNLE